MYNLCFGMKVIDISQMPGGSYSHPNQAVDLKGIDKGVDFWYAQGRWRCIAGPWGANTYFFTAVNENGDVTAVHCADGKDRTVTLALTHSELQYNKTRVGRIYENLQPMYEEGMKSANPKYKVTGNHIHAEVAYGIHTTKHERSNGIYTMDGELPILDVMFVNDAFSTVAKDSKGKDQLKHCESLIYKEEPKKETKMLYGVDISNWQKDIDVSKLKKTDFVIIKATEGYGWTDPSFVKLFNMARNAGKLLGTYYFARPKNNDPLQDAKYYTDKVKSVCGDSHPVYVLDWESSPISNTAWAEKWLDRVKELTGVTPWIYMNLNCERSYDWSSIAKKYPLWLAQYPTSKEIVNYDMSGLVMGKTKHWAKPVMWQFTSNGKIDGYSGRLDCNVFYGTKSDWEKYAKGTSVKTARLRVVNVGAYIREKPVNGKIIGFIKVGESAKIIGFTDRFESDGYQWAYVEHNGITGYSQLDLRNAYRVEVV